MKNVNSKISRIALIALVANLAPTLFAAGEAGVYGQKYISRRFGPQLERQVGSAAEGQAARLGLATESAAQKAGQQQLSRLGQAAQRQQTATQGSYQLTSWGQAGQRQAAQAAAGRAELTAQLQGSQRLQQSITPAVAFPKQPIKSTVFQRLVARRQGFDYSPANSRAFSSSSAGRLEPVELSPYQQNIANQLKVSKQPSAFDKKLVNFIEIGEKQLIELRATAQKKLAAFRPAEQKQLTELIEAGEKQLIELRATAQKKLIEFRPVAQQKLTQIIEAGEKRLTKLIESVQKKLAQPVELDVYEQQIAQELREAERKAALNRMYAPAGPVDYMSPVIHRFKRVAEMVRMYHQKPVPLFLRSTENIENNLQKITPRNLASINRAKDGFTMYADNPELGIIEKEITPGRLLSAEERLINRSFYTQWGEYTKNDIAFTDLNRFLDPVTTETLGRWANAVELVARNPKQLKTPNGMNEWVQQLKDLGRFEEQRLVAGDKEALDLFLRDLAEVTAENPQKAMDFVVDLAGKKSNGELIYERTTKRFDDFMRGLTGRDGLYFGQWLP